MSLQLMIFTSNLFIVLEDYSDIYCIGFNSVFSSVSRSLFAETYASYELMFLFFFQNSLQNFTRLFSLSCSLSLYNLISSCLFSSSSAASFCLLHRTLTFEKSIFIGKLTFGAILYFRKLSLEGAPG